MKKVFKIALFLVALTVVSCSSDSSTTTGAGNEPVTPPAIAMQTEIDGVSYQTPPQAGGNLAENSGGTSFGGTAYFLLKGYKSVGARMTAKVGSKIYNIYLAIPKNDLSVGIHFFSAAFNSGDYYADLDITGVIPSETVNTTGGFIKVTSFDATTRILKGNFNFTTNDGVDLATDSHSVIGSFEYKLP